MRSRLAPVLALLVAAAALPAVAADGVVCADCHEDVVTGMSNQVHMRIEPFEVQGHRVGCEGCHGDGAAHAESGDPAMIRTFETSSPDNAAACLDCHRRTGMGEWHASTHAAEGVLCMDCHTIHGDSDPLDTCATCHADVVAQFQLPSHHPVREGKMSCVSCHDSHAATESNLRTHQRLNDLCFTCHQAKEGPFVFEHPPVVEDCSICHTPHGSVANNLLTVNEPMLCLQCHDFHFHAGLRAADAGHVDVGGLEYENPHGELGFNRAFTTKCTQCHVRVHGTDLPSQTVPGGGRGLIR